MKITEYRIEIDHDASSLAAKVQALTREGWQPFGSLQVVCPVLSEDPSPCFYQPVVKYSEKP